MESAQRLFLAAAVLVLAGCATQTQWMTFPVTRGGKGVPLDVWLKEHPLPSDQDVSIEEISRGETSSAALVRIRKTEPPHVHENHDLTAIVLKGLGTLSVGNRKLELKPGSIVTIPRGVPHSFVNKSPEPAVAYVMFMPAFDGKDMVPVKEEEPVSAVRK